VAVPPRTTKCEFMDGDPAQQVQALVERLQTLKLI
jgi:hypothetical protein